MPQDTPQHGLNRALVRRLTRLLRLPSPFQLTLLILSLCLTVASAWASAIWRPIRINVRGPLSPTIRQEITRNHPLVQQWIVTTFDRFSAKRVVSGWRTDEDIPWLSETDRDPAHLIPSWARWCLLDDPEQPRAKFGSRSCQAHGWPFLAMKFEMEMTAQPVGQVTNLSRSASHIAPRALVRRKCLVLPMAAGASEPIALPVGIVPLGFLGNAAAWYIVLLLPCLGWRWLRTWRRSRRGGCPTCGYDLRGQKAPPGRPALQPLRCPECGTTVRQSAMPAATGR